MIASFTLSTSINKKNIIFDLDGTLSDTAKATIVAIDNVREKYELPAVSNEDICNAMGFAGIEFFVHLYPNLPRELLIEIEVVVGKIEEDTICTIGKEILFPGIEDLLYNLNKNRCNLYIASTGSKSHVYTVLRTANIEQLFTGIHCGEPGKINMVRDIIKEQSKDEWLMVGDMIKDSEAAKANDIFVLGAGYGYLNKQNTPLFDAVLKTPYDLFYYL